MCIYIYMYVCMFVCMYVCICICITTVGFEHFLTLKSDYRVWPGPGVCSSMQGEGRAVRGPLLTLQPSHCCRHSPEYSTSSRLCCSHQGLWGLFAVLLPPHSSAWWPIHNKNFILGTCGPSWPKGAPHPLDWHTVQHSITKHQGILYNIYEYIYVYIYLFIYLYIFLYRLLYLFNTLHLKPN